MKVLVWKLFNQIMHSPAICYQSKAKIPTLSIANAPHLSVSHIAGPACKVYLLWKLKKCPNYKEWVPNQVTWHVTVLSLEKWHTSYLALESACLSCSLSRDNELVNELDVWLLGRLWRDAGVLLLLLTRTCRVGALGDSCGYRKSSPRNGGVAYTKI